MAKRGSNIYKRKDGRFEGRVPIGYQENGKLKYRYVYSKTLTEVKEKMALVHSGEAQNEQSKIKLTVKDIAEQWYEEKKLTVKASSHTSYWNLIKNHVNPKLGGIRYTALTKQMLNKYISDLLVSGRKDGKGGLSSKTVRDIIVVLKSVCGYANHEYGLSNLGESIKLPKIEKNIGKRLAFDQQERIRLEQYLLYNRNLTNMGILLCLYTGIRIGELCALQWHDVDFSLDHIRIYKTIIRISNGDGTTSVVIGPPKSTTSIRDVPVPEFVINLLRRNKSTGRLYILSGNGIPVEPRTMQNRFKSVLGVCNLRNLNFHALRHTYATMCAENGFDVKSLSELLGHADVSITMSYVHSTSTLKKSYVSRLNKQSLISS